MNVPNNHSGATPCSRTQSTLSVPANVSRPRVTSLKVAS
ncbi:hypothetical protein CYQXPUPM_0011 [Klebsiella phage Saitama]|uniref:Uncharacterized protein n=1 Tax=Klebsiella phage Saitama TaxID=3018528 RepID=A0AAF0D7F0_9CAUD|nr:hypothetical protein CYQXPUPM_0011 [Klebsiella phage Saitama]